MRDSPNRTRGAICCRIQHLVTGNFPRPSPSSRRHQPSRPDRQPCVLSARRRCRRRCCCRCRGCRGCCVNRSRASTREGQEPRLINGIRLLFTFLYMSFHNTGPRPVTDCSRGWSNTTLRLRLLRERTQRRGDAARARASCSSMRSVVIYDELLQDEKNKYP